MNQACVASRPNQILIQRRRRDGKNDAITIAFGRFDRRRRRRFAVMRCRHTLRCTNHWRTDRSRKIGTNCLPMQSAIHGFHYVLRPQIERGGLSRRKNQHWTPGAPIFTVVDLRIPNNRGPGTNILTEAGAFVKACSTPITIAQIDNVRVVGIDDDISALAWARGEQIARCDLPMIGVANDGSRSAILLRAIHDIGKLIVGSYVVKLRRGLVVPGAPGSAAIEADGSALIGPKNQAGRILRIDPQLVIIIASRSAADDRYRFSAILGAIKSDIGNVNYIGMLRIDGDPVEVPSPAGKTGIVISQHPGVAAIVRAIKARLRRRSFGLGLHPSLLLDLGLSLNENQRVHALAIRRNVDAYASPVAFWQPVALEASPGFTRVLRSIQCAARPFQRSVRAPRRTMSVPGAGKYNLRRRSTNRQIGNADLRSQVENPRPMRASVDGLIHPTLRAGTIRMPESAHIHDVRILLIDGNPADVARVLESDVMPGRAAVRRFINAVAEREAGTNVALAGSRINRLRIGGSHGERADGSHRLAIENRRPHRSRIGRLPDSAIDRAEVKGGRIARHARDSHRASTAEGANQAPFEPVHQLRWNTLGDCREGGRQNGRQCHGQ